MEKAQAVLQELKADAEGLAVGVMIEAKHDPKVGYTGTLLVQNGKLKIGDPFVLGLNFGKVKSMEDHTGKRIKEAGPSTPVKISGFTGTPQAGDVLQVAASDMHQPFQLPKAYEDTKVDNTGYGTLNCVAHFHIRNKFFEFVLASYSFRED